MSKKKLQSNIQILIIGGSSKIAREAFKFNKEYDVVGFSKFSKTIKIKEFKFIKYKNISSIKKYIDKQKNKKFVLLFMQAASNSNIILNKTSKELLNDIYSNFLNFHEIVKLVLPYMLNQKWGRIIFCGSSRALKTDVGLAGYSSGKYAALGYCKTLSKEYARYGITTNYLSLGIFDTPLFLSLNKKIKKNLLDNTDTRTLGDYKSIFNALNFLIKSNYVTSSVIKIDGGFN